jgi:predicted transposase YdaD
MHEYDVTLKTILMRPGSLLLSTLTGTSGLKWLNVELPKVNNRHLDLLGQNADGDLFGIELQSRNERRFLFRMGTYLFATAERYGKLPRQVVLYVGAEPLRMKTSIDVPDLRYRFHIVDVRDLDGDALLRSPHVGDNVIAVLTAIGGEPKNLRRILKRIAACRPADRAGALSELLILAGLRKLRPEIVREVKKMPILDDFVDDEVFGPLILRGRAEGRVEGRVEGRAEGQMDLVVGQIAKRFGRLRPELRKRLHSLKPDELTAVGLRLFDARTVDDLFVN